VAAGNSVATFSPSWDDLLVARSIIEALIESKSPLLADSQQPLLTSATTSPRRRGHIELKTIPDKKRGKSYGPYRYLRYWSGGKLRSAYLGKATVGELPVLGQGEGEEDAATKCSYPKQKPGWSNQEGVFNG
jgi:hypothetical protein